jgi:hypothetical protein
VPFAVLRRGVARRVEPSTTCLVEALTLQVIGGAVRGKDAENTVFHLFAGSGSSISFRLIHGCSANGLEGAGLRVNGFAFAVFGCEGVGVFGVFFQPCDGERESACLWLFADVVPVRRTKIEACQVSFCIKDKRTYDIAFFIFYYQFV